MSIEHLVFGWTLTVVALFLAVNSLAAEMSADDAIPPLRPPLGPIPPSFWERYGGWVIGGSLLFVLLVVGLLWLLLRPRTRPPVPPEVQARGALQPLEGQPETGPVLSRVSQVVRFYFGAAFGLPPGELTTGEFCRAIRERQEVGPRLQAQVGSFLRACDERKFSLAPATEPLGAVVRAEQLIEAAEMRRAELRAAAQTAAPAQAGGSSS